jgi:C4-dicarboxylate-specific signal transduction histidine kinase
MTPHFINEEMFRPLRSSKSTGLGIGAYQARQTMRDLNGDLEVRSTLGAGTLVQLVLPHTVRAA